MMNLLQLGLDAQAASIGKGPLTEKKPAIQPLDYLEPPSRVCPSCGRKHWRAMFDLCLSCSQKD